MHSIRIDINAGQYSSTLVFTADEEEVETMKLILALNGPITQTVCDEVPGLFAWAAGHLEWTLGEGMWRDACAGSQEEVGEIVIYNENEAIARPIPVTWAESLIMNDYKIPDMRHMVTVIMRWVFETLHGNRLTLIEDLATQREYSSEQ